MRPELREDGRWANCPCWGECRCRPDCAVSLPGPVAEVTEVRLDGAVLPPSAYRVMGNELIRLDGGCWPDCPDLGPPDDAPGTWSVTYRRGRPVPPGGRAAVTALAVELHKACTGARGCRLPGRVEQIQREGITYTMLNSPDDTEAIRALPEVHQWVSLVNPQRRGSPPGVWSPDLPTTRADHPGGAW